MEIFTATAIGATAIKMAVKPLSDLYESAKGEIKSVIEKWNISGERDKITQRILEVELVRTITSHHLISLSDFYYPSKVRIGKNIKSAKSISDISEDKNILISGTVGQGKSVYMRYLCVAELRIGKKIPVFVELRDIDASSNLENLLIYKLGLLGLTEINPDTFSFLLTQGAFVFFLDGFDEIKREYALNVQKTLSSLIKIHPKTKWVVSSRPGSLGEFISTLPSFTPVTLEKLNLSDFEDFF